MPLKYITATKTIFAVCIFAYSLCAITVPAISQDYGTPEVEVDMSVLGTLPKQAIEPGTVSRPTLIDPRSKRPKKATQAPRLTVYPVKVREVSGAIDPGLKEPVREVVTVPPVSTELRRPAQPIQKIMPSTDIPTFEPVKAPAPINSPANAALPAETELPDTKNILDHGMASKVTKGTTGKIEKIEPLQTALFTPPIPDKKPTFFVNGVRTTNIKGNVMPPARIAAKPKPVAVKPRAVSVKQARVEPQPKPKPERIRIGAFDRSESKSNRIEAKPMEKKAYIIPGEPTMPAVPARTVKAEPLKTNQIPIGAKDRLTRNLKHVEREDMVNIVSDISTVAGKMAEKNEKAGRARTVTKFDNNATIPRMPQASAPLEAQQMEIEELKVANIATETLLAASLAEIEPAATNATQETDIIGVNESEGIFEITFPKDVSETLNNDVEKALRHNVLSILRNQDESRVEISSFGALEGGVNARKVSLSRALVIRDFLINNGINAERIDVKALPAELSDKENTVSFAFGS